MSRKSQSAPPSEPKPGASPASAPAATVSPSLPDSPDTVEALAAAALAAASQGGEQGATDGVKSDEAGETVAQEQATASAPLASLDAVAIDETARETLFGTIGFWGRAGADEIERVSGLLQAQSWSAAELSVIRAALEAVETAAQAAIAALAAPVDAIAIAVAHGYSAGDVLAFDPARGIVVTRDGRKLGSA